MILTLGFTKLSILWFCRRLFVVHKRDISDMITIGLTCLVALWTLAYFFAYALYCGGHASALWGTPLQEKKYCLAIASNGRQLQYSMVITDMFLDLFCVIIPFPIVSPLSEHSNPINRGTKLYRNRFGACILRYPRRLGSSVSSLSAW